MAVTYDNAASAVGNGTTASVAITCAANSLVIVAVHFNGGPTASSPTFDGNAMTLIDGPITDVYLYRYTGHASGSRTASVTRSTSGDWAIGVVSVTGFDSGDPVGTHQSESTDETSPFTTPAITSGSADWMIVDACMAASDSLAMAADGAQTERVSLDSYNGGSLNFGMSTKPGSASTTTMSWTSAGTIFGVGLIAVPIRPSAAGGTVYTQTLSDTVAIADTGLPSMTSGRIVEDALTIADAGLDYVFYSRLGSDSVTVTDGPLESFNVYGVVAISEVTVSDDFLAWMRRHRLLEDNVLVTDELVSTVIGYLIFTSILTSNVSVTDEALKTTYFYRLAESNLVTEDQLLTALLVARDLLDGVEVTDSTLTSMQRFILLTDTISLEDALTALYVPYAMVNPLIRIGFDQPEVKLGGYSVN